MLASYLLLTHT